MQYKFARRILVAYFTFSLLFGSVMFAIRLLPYTNNGLKAAEIILVILAIVLFCIDLLMITKIYIISVKFFWYLLKKKKKTKYFLFGLQSLTALIMIIRSFYRNVEKNIFDLNFFYTSESGENNITFDQLQSQIL